MFKSFKKALEGLDGALGSAGPLGEASPAELRVGKHFRCGPVSFRINQIVAEGGYSFVYAAEDLDGPNVYYAVKVILITDEEVGRRAQEEIELLRGLPHHPNIMRFIAGKVHDQEAMIVSELIDGGSLADKLLRKHGSTFSETEILRIMADTAQALAHLHAQQPPIAHRDLKLENVLYDRLQGRFKLCDFGSCTTKACRYESFQEIAKEEEVIAAHSTLMYRAPEMVDLYQKKLVCEKVDVWALGCMFYTLCYSVHPFQDGTSLQILNAKYTTPESPSYPPTFDKLLKSMLNPNPETRPDVFIILEGLCRLSGRQMDPALKRLGDRRRNNPEASTSRVSTTRTLNSSSVPAGVSKSKDQRSSQPMGLDNPQKPQGRSEDATKPAVAVAQKEDPLISFERSAVPASDDWADFEGVFGGSEQSAANTVQGTNAEPVAARITGSNSSTPGDFLSDLYKSSSDAGSTTTSVDPRSPYSFPSSKQSIQSKNRSADPFADLLSLPRRN
eukprot:CAMPEP_0184738376 /NCGR_PEP_ID=MMETSP0315-20130426/1038_1 /TAXON_ID=101924 /ORGANISM="Rhodosorus marinus, Strain UTEX LB 2760" /LENGTH=501 /DNA_ID=CAMNT_0027206055 /DNA_START=145 /DNA_END=1650 /DNA_ORIENTATION=-